MKETNYQPLTKKIKIGNEEKIVCTLFGTQRCCIHNDNSCKDCKIFQLILEQLYAFEQIYLESEDNPQPEL